MITASTEYENFVAKLIEGVQSSNRKITNLEKGQKNKSALIVCGCMKKAVYR